MSDYLLADHAVLVGSDRNDTRLLNFSELYALSRLDLFIAIVNLFARLETIHHRHIDVHQNESEVPLTAGLHDIFYVLFKALLAIGAGGNVQIWQHLLQLHLNWH